MHDWLKKNQKKLLALMGAFLMVSFLVNVPLGSLTSGSGGRGAPIGKFGKTVLYDNDRRHAALLWKLLEGSYSETLHKQQEQMEQIAKEDKEFIDRYGEEVGQMILDGQRRQGRPVPRFIDIRATVLLDPAHPGLVAREMKDHPELFFLLVKEADQRGISISTDRLHEVMKNEILPDINLLGPKVDPNDYEEAVRDFLKLQALRDLVLNDAKYTEAKWDHVFTEICRVERLNRVEYSADVAALKAPPTTQQVQALYDQFKNVDPDDPNKPASDPLGFGYFQPNRVKVQYLTVSRKDVLAYFKKRINDKSGVSDDDLLLRKKAWDEYYGKNKDDYGRQYEAQQIEQQASQIEQQAQHLLRLNVLGTTNAALESSAKAAESDAQQAERNAQSAQRSARAARDSQAEDTARMKSVEDTLKSISDAKKAIDTANKELAQALIEAAKPPTTRPATQPSTQPFGPIPLPDTTQPATRPTTRSAAAYPTSPLPWFDGQPACGVPTFLALATQLTTSPATLWADTTQPTTGPITLWTSATQPTTSPTTLWTAATQPTTMPATLLTSATQPTTRPSSATAPAAVATSGPAATQAVSQDQDDKIFDQLSDDIISVGLKSDIDKMESDVGSAIRNKMLEDWHAGPRIIPATLPAATAMALPYSSGEYLPEVAKFIQAQFKILPQFTQLPNWQTARQAKDLSGIGASVALVTDLYGQWGGLFRFGLAVWEPSQLVKDDAGNAHIFRLTDASPAHPKDLNEVSYPFVAWNFAWGPSFHPLLTKVEEDTKLKLAYDEAKAKADQLVQRVKSGQTLTKAARADAKEPTTTEYFNSNTASSHHISPEVAAEAEKLLAKASDKDPNPIAVIEVPASREVLVIQLDSVIVQVPEQIRRSGLSLEDLRFHERLRLSETERARTGNSLAESFFNFDAVSKRMGYQSDAASRNGS